MVCSSLRQGLQMHWITAKSTILFILFIYFFTLVKAKDLARGDGATWVTRESSWVRKSDEHKVSR